MQEKYHIKNVDAILSPSLVLFSEIVKKNMLEMVRIAGNPIRLRPHCKTHKMAQVIRMAMSMHIDKQKCATIAEAEMLASTGCRDILIAYQLVGPNLDRLVHLTDNLPEVRFGVLVDCVRGVQMLAQAMDRGQRGIDVYVDLNPGMMRTGIETGDSAKQLYTSIEQYKNLNAKGFQWYDGHHRQKDIHQRRDAVLDGWKRCKEFQLLVERDAKPVECIVACGTGSFPILAEIDDPVLELSPGTVMFFDRGYQVQFPEMNFVPAAVLLTRVVSDNQDHRLTLDLGHKACAADPPLEKRVFFPMLPDARIVMQNEEHLVIETQQANRFQLGDYLIGIPWHVCPTTALHEFVYVVNGDGATEQWKVDARNRVLSY